MVMKSFSKAVKCTAEKIGEMYWQEKFQLYLSRFCYIDRKACVQSHWRNFAQSSMVGDFWWSISQRWRALWKGIRKGIKAWFRGIRKSVSSARRARPLPSSHSGSRRDARHSGSLEEGENEKKRKNKSVSFSDTGTPVHSDDSSSSAKKASAREQRSLRRQAKIDEDVVFTVQSGASGSIKRRLPSSRNGSGGNINSSNKRTKGENGNEEVVKVKLLPGTLYLYRGLHRRAEFIRRV